MAQTIQIKRSTGNGKPTSVPQGELFYAYGTGGTYGKKLAIGNVSCLLYTSPSPRDS